MKKHIIAAAAAFVLGAFAATTSHATEFPKVANKCKACHSFEMSSKSKMGPNLLTVYGREAGSMIGYRYGSGLEKAKFKWNEERLTEWLYSTKEFALDGKTKMPSMNIKDPAKAKAIVDYLMAISDRRDEDGNLIKID